MSALAPVRTGPAVDVLVDQPSWNEEPAAEAVVRAAIEALCLEVAMPDGAEMAITLADDASVRGLNRTWRGKDAPTNVLSFPAAGPNPPGIVFLGDVIVAYETLQREAQDAKIPFAHHLAHLTVHGVLHLLGHDHDTDAAAETMERLERRALARLSIADPYAAQVPEHNA